MRIRWRDLDVHANGPLGVCLGGSGLAERKLDLGAANEDARQSVGPRLVAFGDRDRLVHLGHRAIAVTVRRGEQPALGRDRPEAGAFRRVGSVELLLELGERLHRPARTGRAHGRPAREPRVHSGR